jgi:hypothetical protein
VTTHCTVTQGCGTTGANVQPVMMNVSEARSTGAPTADARVLPGIAVTNPPCGHIIVLDCVSSSGIT